MGYSPWHCKKVGHNLVTEQEVHHEGFNICIYCKVYMTISLVNIPHHRVMLLFFYCDGGLEDVFS